MAATMTDLLRGAASAALLALCAAAPAPAGDAAAPMVFRSESVELPVGDRTFPGGTSADAINANCVTCHSAGMVLNQPALSRADWTTEVHKMANVYKAPVSDADQAAIIDYLAATRGRP